MAIPKGFEHFCKALQGLEENYVIIGGGAAAILFHDQGLEFRATADVDVVVVARSKDLNKRILEYVKAGEYQSKEASKEKPQYFRFSNPKNSECPKIIELFARAEDLELNDGQYIIPVEKDEAGKLSAILLDDEYFALIKSDIQITDSKIPIIGPIANACLKARAYRELTERKENEKARKHLKDIWRLSITLTGDETPKLVGLPKTDIENALSELAKLTPDQFKGAMEKLPATLETVMAKLKKVFTPLPSA